MSEKPSIRRIGLPLAKSLLPIEFADIHARPKQLKFVAAYCSNGFSARLAALESGYGRRTDVAAESAGQRMLRDPIVVELIKRFMAVVIGPYKDRLEYVALQIYYKRATYDVRVFYDDNGRIRDLDDIPADWRVCIDGVDEAYEGNPPKRVVSYKLPNRDMALQTLYRVATGYEPESTKALPAETRQRLAEIYGEALKSQGRARGVKRRVTLTVVEDGRPRVGKRIRDISPKSGNAAESINASP
jgi:hypothetical protein